MGEFVSSIILGAVSRGVNKPTVIFVNVSLCLGIALLLGSLSSGVLPNDLTVHLSVLLSLMTGLILSFNWVIAQTGVESIENQKTDLKLA